MSFDGINHITVSKCHALCCCLLSVVVSSFDTSQRIPIVNRLMDMPTPVVDGSKR